MTAYDPGDFYDEALEQGGQPRAHYRDVMEALAGADLPAVAAAILEEAHDHGVKYGEGRFVIDPVPRVVTAAEWAALEPGLAQRVRALGAFVADVYGERAIAAAGRVPARVLEASEHHEPEMHGAGLPASAWVGLAGLDVVRGGDGSFYVLEDNTRTPTGFAYAAAARELRARHLPIDGPRVEDVHEAAIDAVGEALRAAAPDGSGDPSIVVLSDGPDNEAWYEQRAIARRLHAPLATLADLDLRSGALWVRDGERRSRVDVVYRRTDEHRLRDDHGCPTAVGQALLEPARAGAIMVVNAFGSGVADDKLAHAYVEEMIRFYLGEEPLLRSVATLDLGDEDVREQALERLDELVLKPRASAGGAGIVIGPDCSANDLDDARRRLRESPGDYVAQETVALSRHPTVIDGALAPRHVDLRALVAIAGDRAIVVPGGLTRVALAAGDRMVNMTQGGGVKDTWVLSAP